MKQGRFARACLHVIDRYQGTKAAHVYDGNCRFDPSCCTFMHEAFSTRAFPIAFLLSAWRLIRCNPLTRERSHDPVQCRSKAPRANSLRTVCAVLSLSAFVVLLLGSTAAFGQSLTGNCQATVNGQNPRALTKNSPLKVTKGQSVAVNGTVPPSIAAATEDSIKSTTNITVSILEPFVDYSSGSSNPGTGPQWGGSVDPESF